MGLPAFLIKIHTDARLCRTMIERYGLDVRKGRSEEMIRLGRKVDADLYPSQRQGESAGADAGNL